MPSHGSLDPQRPGPTSSVGAFLGAQAVVQLADLRGDPLRARGVERTAADVDDVRHAFDRAEAQRAFGVDQRVGGPYAVPVERPGVLLLDDRADLQKTERPLGPVGDVHVDGELHFDRAAHFLLAHAEQIADDLRERDRVVFEYLRERDDAPAVLEQAVGYALVLHVPDRRDVAHVAEMLRLVDLETLQIDRVVDRRLELFGLQVQRVHFPLRVAQRQLGRRELKRVFRVAGRKAQRQPAVDDQLSEPEGEVHNAVLRLLVAYRVIVQRTGDARNGREIVTSVLRSQTSWMTMPIFSSLSRLPDARM